MDSEKENEALKRLLRLSQRELGSEITMENILDFTKALKIVAKSKGTVIKYDDIWHLALIDTEYYPYICSFINEKYIQHNPLGGKKLTPRREQFKKSFSETHKKSITRIKSKKKPRRISRAKC